MPPKTAKKATSSKAKARDEDSSSASASEDPFTSSPEQRATTKPTARGGGSGSSSGRRQGNSRARDSAMDVDAEEEEEEPEKSIPADLLTRILHEFFAKDATRISKGANEAVGKYLDIFVREAIARAAVEKRSGFFEVEDLEKVAPQLLLDL